MNQSDCEQSCWKALGEWVAGARTASQVIGRLFPYYLALAAVYYFGIEYSNQRGCPLISPAMKSSLLQDGIQC